MAMFRLQKQAPTENKELRLFNLSLFLHEQKVIFMDYFCKLSSNHSVDLISFCRCIFLSASDLIF